MANLNLSEFTEKLFVADADHTFIWDSAASISKRVSRNSWLNSGTLTSDAPVTISQTWNNAAVAFTGLKVNAASTASAAGSLLLDLQVGGVSQFSVQRNGTLRMTSTDAETKLSYSAAGFLFFGSGAPSLFIGQDGTGNGNAVMGNTGFIGFSSAFTAASGNADTRLYRDGAANTLALRNGAAAQTFRVYGAYPDTGINYARLALSCDTSGNATISTQALGTYTAGTVSINGVPVGLGLLNVSTSVAIGTGALAANTSALGGNTAVGNGSLLTATNIYWSTAIGYRALAGLTGFSNSNVALGYEAGSQITSGVNFQCSSSVFIGYNTKALGNNQNNQIVIGASAIGIGDNSVVLGNDSITKTALKGNVGIGTTSPTSKLQVANGDVEIETVTSGIIMKAAGTANRFRITLNAGGTDFVITAL